MLKHLFPWQPLKFHPRTYSYNLQKSLTSEIKPRDTGLKPQSNLILSSQADKDNLLLKSQRGDLIASLNLKSGLLPLIRICKKAAESNTPIKYRGFLIDRSTATQVFNNIIDHNLMIGYSDVTFERKKSFTRIRSVLIKGCFQNASRCLS